MSEKRETILVRECRVSFLCKICGVLFKCVSTYCTHKFENHHSLKFLHNKCLVFEESTFELNDNEPGTCVDPVVQDVCQIIQLDDMSLVPVEVKQEAPAAVIFNSVDDTVKSTVNASNNYHVNLSLVAPNNDDSEPSHNSGIKAEWVEDTSTSVKYETFSENEDPLCHQNSENNLQENEDYENINYGNETELQSSYSMSDSDPNHMQQVSDGGPDPLEDFDVTQSNPSTSTLTPTQMEQEYFNENSSDSDEEIICLSASPSPSSAANKFASLTGPRARAASTSNSFILSQLKLQCTLCSKQFSSSGQLGIHVAICELYSGKIKEFAAAGPSQPEAERSRSRMSSRSPRKVKGGCSKFNSFVNCEECFKKIRRCNLNAHLRTEHEIFIQEADRKYVCQRCDSAFQANYLLRRHSKVHSDERPFVCPFPDCYSAFKDERNLKQHLKKTNHQLNQFVEMI